MLSFIRRFFRSKSDPVSQPEHAWRVWDSGDALHCIYQNKEKSVTWDSVVEIQIVTTDEGPLLPDVFWRVKSICDEVVFPQMALGEKEVADRVMKMPNYDFAEMTRAMSSVENAEFIVWRKGRV